MATSRSPNLFDLISRRRIYTSGELSRLLVAKGLNPDAARKLISRNSSTDGVWRSEHLKLARNERLLAQRNFVGSFEFLSDVIEKLRKQSRHGLARCLELLKAEGCLHKSVAMRLLAVSDIPIRDGDRLRRQYERESAALEELGIQISHRNTCLECFHFPFAAETSFDVMASRAASMARRNSLLVRLLIDYLKRQNILVWNQVELPDLETGCVSFNGQPFSGYSFSYLSPSVSWNKNASKPTPCPVLVDSYPETCTVLHLESLFQRIENATVRNRSAQKYLGIIAAKTFEREAWNIARSKGLLTVNYLQMFGEQALDAMAIAEGLLGELRDHSESDFYSFAEAVETLKANPIIVAIRSIGFEILCGLSLSSLGYESIEFGKLVPWKETHRDIDVFGFRGNELRLVECKALRHSKSIGSKDIKKFFTETVPAIKKWSRKNDRSFATCRAEIWTTGKYDADARKVFEDLKRDPKDNWKVLQRDDIVEILPDKVVNRAIDFLDSIALEKLEGES